jgi:ABC-type sugar transport system ATPase subunit
LDEIMALSDRISEMNRATVVSVLAREEATKEQIGLLMAGIMPDDVKSEGSTNRNEKTAQ